MAVTQDTDSTQTEEHAVVSAVIDTVMHVSSKNARISSGIFKGVVFIGVVSLLQSCYWLHTRTSDMRRII